ncbi:TetR/AcrR family transcriptional regulator [Actinospica durhamensis]|uniref:TetR/AcrR family transcriptional regulator n=1 Tax=Actinospica durhamensis TaxID=1508375 RepID=A0A941EWY1_9ACTN|nr:TetR/AcrR family transcriptional regulator [Actinospica durhamensis]MBR7838823.1 TetR/AcrR family transcriptional regulator [Actinospica durhamensis]
MTATPRSRAEVVGDTAIAVLAAQGARGLTHRAVDRAADLPPGSTSNHARTREALLTCALARITELEAADAAALAGGRAGGSTGGGGSAAGAALALEQFALDPAAFAAPIAAMLHHGLTSARARLLARYELALEATRRPALRALYDEAARPFREPVQAMLEAAGSADPARHARTLIAWCEGVQFDAVAGAGTTAVPTRAQLQSGLEELLRGMLGGVRHRGPRPPRSQR